MSMKSRNFCGNWKKPITSKNENFLMCCSEHIDLGGPTSKGIVHTLCGYHGAVIRSDLLWFKYRIDRFEYEDLDHSGSCSDMA